MPLEMHAAVPRWPWGCMPQTAGPPSALCAYQEPGRLRLAWEVECWWHAFCLGGIEEGSQHRHEEHSGYQGEGQVHWYRPDVCQQHFGTDKHQHDRETITQIVEQAHETR